MWGWVGVVARLVVGIVWIVAGALKIPDPAEGVRAVRAYQLLPEAVVPTIGYLLPILEVIVGVCLVLGLLTRVNAVISSVLLVAFIIGIASVWARGIDIDCGCFGGSGGSKKDYAALYPWDIARDVGLLLLSAFLVWGPRSRLSLDARLFSPDKRELTHVEEEVHGHA